MVTMDAFASAFGFDAKSDDVWTTLGKVTAVNGGTLSVLLGGSATPTECEAYCLAGVGDIVFVAITKGRARAIACKGVDAATWRTALGLGSIAIEDADDYLPVSGGTLTGEPTVLQHHASIKRSTADSTLSDNGVSADSYLYYRFLDKNDLFTGWLGNILQTNGMVQTQLAARKKVNGSNVDNILYLDVDKNGNCTITFSNPAAWCRALGYTGTSSTSGVFTKESSVTIRWFRCTKWGNVVSVSMSWYTSQAISVPANGNTTDFFIGTFAAGYRPPGPGEAHGTSSGDGAGAAWYYIGSNGQLQLGACEGTGSARTIVANTAFDFHAAWVV